MNKDLTSGFGLGLATRRDAQISSLCPHRGQSTPIPGLRADTSAVFHPLGFESSSPPTAYSFSSRTVQHTASRPGPSSTILCGVMKKPKEAPTTVVRQRDDDDPIGRGNHLNITGKAPEDVSVLVSHALTLH